MGASVEPREAPARRWKAVTRPPSGGVGCWMAGCGRTGAVGCHTVSHDAPGPRPASQPVSTKAPCAVHRRMTTRLGAPQVGQRAAGGGGGWRGGARAALAGPCPSIRRMVASGTAQRAGSKPQCRTVCQPSGNPG
jgi:hypothetical protein